MSDRLVLPETGVVRIGAAIVIAQAIGHRPRYGGPADDVALRASLVLGEGERVDVEEGDEVDVAGARWRVEAIHEDRAHNRGSVVIARV